MARSEGPEQRSPISRDRMCFHLTPALQPLQNARATSARPPLQSHPYIWPQIGRPSQEARTMKLPHQPACVAVGPGILAESGAYAVPTRHHIQAGLSPSPSTINRASTRADHYFNLKDHQTDSPAFPVGL